MARKLDVTTGDTPYNQFSAATFIAMCGRHRPQTPNAGAA
jgi:hypothetical protein